MNKENLKTSISTVTPVYSGANYLDKLAEQLKEVRDKWAKQNAPITLIESIFVDDGSIDNSDKILKKLQEKYNWITVITLSKNYGQHSATVAGICHTSSDWVVTLDEDLQHHPKLIEQLIKNAVLEKHDIVYAKPTASSHGNTWRDKTSKFTKNLIAVLTGLSQIKMFNSFRLIRGGIARSAASSSSSQTYFDIALSWYTNSAGLIKLNMKDERFIDKKESSYAFSKLIKHAKRLVISSEINIATKGMWIGILFFILAITIGGYVVIQKLLFPETIGGDGWASLVAIICAFSGLIIALICIIMEYVNIVLLNQLGRPTFFTIDRNSDKLLRKWFTRI